jgi:glycosyltransferase 2 family protein
MKYINKNRIFISILLITLFYIIFIFYSDFDKIKTNYQNFNILYFLPVLPILFFSMFCRSLVQRYLLKNMNIQISIKSSFLIFLGGYSMIMTPGGVGLIIKSYLIQKKYGHKISKSIPLVFAERFYDILAVEIIILSTLFLFFSITSVILSILLGIGIGTAILFIKVKKFNSFFLSIITKLKIIDDEQNSKELFLETIQKLFKINFFIKISIIITGLTFFEGIIIFLSFQIFNIDIGYIESIQVYYTSMLLGALSLLPAGIGAIESLFVFLLSEKNISLDLATSTILFIRFITIWLLAGIGIIISLKLFSK